MKQRKMYRQGDVLIERVNKSHVNRSKTMEREGGKVILAHGEVTGHAHAIAEHNVHQYAGGAGVTFLEIQEAVALLKHEEHGTIELPQGTYRVTRQREYSPEEIRNVAD